MRIFASCGCGVMALAITPPGVFGDLPVFGKASKQPKISSETALWLEPVRIAGKYSHLWRYLEANN